MIKYNINKI